MESKEEKKLRAVSILDLIFKQEFFFFFHHEIYYFLYIFLWWCKNRFRLMFLFGHSNFRFEGKKCADMDIGNLCVRVCVRVFARVPHRKDFFLSSASLGEGHSIVCLGDERVRTYTHTHVHKVGTLKTWNTWR